MSEGGGGLKEDTVNNPLCPITPLSRHHSVGLYYSFRRRTALLLTYYKLINWYKKVT